MCDLVIALTHMRVPNDTKLLQSDVDIDLILGGHDHHYEVKKVLLPNSVQYGGRHFRFISVYIDYFEMGYELISPTRKNISKKNSSMVCGVQETIS